MSSCNVASGDFLGNAFFQPEMNDDYITNAHKVADFHESERGTTDNEKRAVHYC